MPVALESVNLTGGHGVFVTQIGKGNSLITCNYIVDLFMKRVPAGSWINVRRQERLAGAAACSEGRKQVGFSYAQQPT